MPAPPRSCSPRRCSCSFRFTLIGKAIRACADNYTGALVVGLDVKHLYALTFALGAACVGAAGTMMTLIIDVTPTSGRPIRSSPSSSSSPAGSARCPAR
jgi:branched-subunit amino acid ABC-type transport system permease component